MSTPPRLPTRDYSAPGWYFVTCNTQLRRPLFGRVSREGIDLSLSGRAVAEEWNQTLQGRPWISCAAWTLMPDHFHALIGWDATPTHRSATLGTLMSQFKGNSSRRIRRRGLLKPWEAVWQVRYYDSIIRGGTHFERVRRYIESNPEKAWLRLAGR